jgi:hypothetical protein
MYQLLFVGPVHELELGCSGVWHVLELRTCPSELSEEVYSCELFHGTIRESIFNNQYTSRHRAFSNRRSKT